MFLATHHMEDEQWTQQGIFWHVISIRIIVSCNNMRNFKENLLVYLPNQPNHTILDKMFQQKFKNSGKIV